LNEGEPDKIVWGIKVSPLIKAQAERLAEQYNIKLSDVIEYLIPLCVQYRLLEPDWKDVIVKEYRESEQFKQDLQKELIEFRKQIEKEAKREDKAYHFKVFLVKQYLETLSEADKKAWLESVLPELRTGVSLDSILGNFELVKIDGKPKLARLTNGIPELTDVKAEDIVKCDAGYHVRYRKCDCPKWRECKIREEERVESMAAIERKRKYGRT